MVLFDDIFAYLNGYIQMLLILIDLKALVIKLTKAFLLSPKRSCAVNLSKEALPLIEALRKAREIAMKNRSPLFNLCLVRRKKDGGDK